jgi:hypothetical protein
MIVGFPALVHVDPLGIERVRRLHEVQAAWRMPRQARDIEDRVQVSVTVGRVDMERSGDDDRVISLSDVRGSLPLKPATSRGLVVGLVGSLPAGRGTLMPPTAHYPAV